MIGMYPRMSSKGVFFVVLLNPGVLCILYNWQPLCPISRLFTCKYAKSLFHLLVGALALSISLRVVCRTHILMNVERFTECRDEF
jgi:hypothetical protein